MKKRNVFLMILIPIFLIGIACIFMGIALGGTLYSYQLRTDGDGGEYQTGTTQLTPDETAAIHGINWNIRTSDVKIVTDESYSVSGSGRYRSFVRDGIWHITTEKKVARITFLNHSIEIPTAWNHNWNWNDDDKNTVTIPADAAFESANIKVAAGALTGETLCADKLTLKTGAGSCTMEEITAKELAVQVGAGSSTLRKLHVSDSCTAKVGAGELVLGSKKIPAGVNSIANLHGKCAAGNMTVTGKLSGNSQLQCAVGDIDVLLDGSRQNYNINSKGSLGEIDIKDHDKDDNWDNDDDDDDDWDDDWDDDNDWDNHHNEHDDHNAPSATQTPDSSGNDVQTSPAPTDGTDGHHGNLSLKCSLGDITVKFQQ